LVIDIDVVIVVGNEDGNTVGKRLGKKIDEKMVVIMESKWE